MPIAAAGGSHLGELFFDPGGLRAVSVTFGVGLLGGLPGPLPRPLASRSRLSIASSICARSAFSSARILETSISASHLRCIFSASRVANLATLIIPRSCVPSPISSFSERAATRNSTRRSRDRDDFRRKRDDRADGSRRNMGDVDVRSYGVVAFVQHGQDQVSGSPFHVADHLRSRQDSRVFQAKETDRYFRGDENALFVLRADGDVVHYAPASAARTPRI